MTQVALVRCMRYDPEAVEAAVRRGIDLCGGIGAFFKPGERIVLKPNVLSGTPPELCVTTHPAVFAAVAKVLQNSGLVLSYGDSPATGKCANAVRAAGLASEAERLGVRCADFDNGKSVRHKTARINGTFPIANGILEADGVVSLP